MSETTAAVATPRRPWWTALKALLLAVTFWYIWRTLAKHWNEVQALAREANFGWGWIIAASVAVLATHAMLVHSWRMLLAGWDHAPGFWRSVRIWTIANLGRYVPGKVWSIGALAVLAGAEGVSGTAAAGAAILGTLLNIGSGFAIAALGGSRALNALAPWMGTVTLLLTVGFLFGTALLPKLLPPMVQFIARRRGVAIPDRQLSARRVWGVAAINAIAWVGYGIAFLLFARGVTPGLASGSSGSLAGVLGAFITVYTASYLWGYLAFFAPGGVMVREAALVAMLGAMGLAMPADAWYLALTSLVWITLLQIAPGILALLVSPRTPRSAVQST